MSETLVSIIIPVYNAGTTIATALQSVIDQSYDSTEILIVDGGSTDDSLNIIGQFKSHLKVLISEPDTGVYHAINKGIDRSEGEWILILGADDYLADNEVLKRCCTTIADDCKLILGDVINFGSSHSLVPDRHHNEMGSQLYWKNTIHQQGAIYHRSIFAEFRFNQSYKILADYDLHLQLFLSKTVYSDSGIVVAHCSAGGLSKQFTAALYSEELKIKRSRLSPLIYVLNIPWVWFKFLAKKWG